MTRSPATLQTHLGRGDQAEMLRGLMRRLKTERPDLPVPAGAGRACAVAVTSGKGGVGKSNIALNLAIGLSQIGGKTCLIDANPGLGNIDLLCGLNGYWNFSHVVTGARELDDILLLGPEGIGILPGASGLAESADWPASAQVDLLRQLAAFEQQYDFLVIDTSAGQQTAARHLAGACDLVLVVTTPEPTSIAEAYATIKALSTGSVGQLDVLVNQGGSARQAHLIAERIQQTARMFLHTDVCSAGWVANDAAVPAAVARRTPFLIDAPRGAASEGVRALALRIEQFSRSQARHGSLFSGLRSRRQRAAA